MDRKGTFVYNLTLVLVLFVVLGYAAFKILTVQKNTETKEVGEIQIKLINLYTKGEKVLFYIGQGAKYSQGEAILDLYNNGGYYSNGCGEIDSYKLWLKGSKTCFLNQETLLSEFSKIYTQKTNSFIATYQEFNLQNEYSVSNENENFILNGKEVILIDGNIKYFIKPIFKIKSENTITDIILINDKIKANIDRCKLDINCWKTVDKNFNIVEKNKVLFFEADMNKEVGFFKKNNLKLKFAIDFNEYNPLFK